MAGIGDTLQQGIVIPIALRAGHRHRHRRRCRDGGAGEHPGPALLRGRVAAFIWGVGWWVWWQGYVRGARSGDVHPPHRCLSAHHSGRGVLGNFIMDALAVQFVRLSTPVAFMVGGSTFRLQAILDSLMPNLLPLLLVLLVWWLVARKNVSPTKVMAAIILIGILSAYPVWPGLNEAGEAIQVGLFGEQAGDRMREIAVVVGHPEGCMPDRRPASSRRRGGSHSRSARPLRRPGGGREEPAEPAGLGVEPGAVVTIRAEGRARKRRWPR